MGASSEIVDRVCESYGIALDYSDIWGERHVVSRESKLALLSAMGVAATDDRTLESVLEQRQRQDWQRLVPPVEVRPVSAHGLSVAVTVPDHRVDRTLAWRLVEEGGREHRGELELAELEPSSRACVDGAWYSRYDMHVPVAVERGYHRLEVGELGQTSVPGQGAVTTLIAVPSECYRPAWLSEGKRIWGLSAQLYGLASERSWGIGDFTDLAALVESAARLGADAIGLSPLHSMFPDAPDRVSPYSPSSRLFLNVLYLDVEAVPDFGDCRAARELVGSPLFQERLAALRGLQQVDYEAMSACKLEVLELLYASFREQHLAPESDRGTAFRAFQSDGGQDLFRHALYESLQEHFRRQEPATWGWPVWPEVYRDPGTPMVEEFAAAHRERIEFFQYLQWEAGRQLQAVTRRCADSGLALGLYLDLALSVDRAGAESWCHQASYALAASIGAPPDEFNLSGQDWGLPPLNPTRLPDAGYAPFVAALRRNMVHGGALRIDHVMGLMRLFWIPQGGRATDGAYVHYPLDDFLGIVALESHRHRCLVVGEDLGTVPDELRAACRRTGILSYRVLLFERDESGQFRPPGDYPTEALTTVSTHDLPTLRGFWEGRDLSIRHELGLVPSEDARERQLVARAQERVRLLLALDREALLPEGLQPDSAPATELDDELVRAAHRFLARSRSAIMMVQLEDVLGEKDQANLPGTTAQHPNWRRKLPRPLESWPAEPGVQALAAAVGEERGPRPSPSPGAGRATRSAATIPAATYRLQLGPDFPLSRAADFLPYLRELGISHCYLSPVLAARPGSVHGYDVIDHGAINPELGGVEGFERFVAALRDNGMGQILDVVPNHMGVMGSDNAWWLDVLEHGPASAFAAYFDIDWRPVKEALRGKVLLPVLGDHYGVVLSSGALELEFARDSGEFAVTYYEHRFPIDPRTYPEILGYRTERLEERLGDDHPAAMELRSVVTAFGHLPERSETAPEAREERSREATIAKQRLASLCRDMPLVAELVEDKVADIQRSAVEIEGADLLHHLLEQQAYRLAYWRVAADDINYRRFFDINSLAGLRMENPDVFQDTHRLVIELLHDGKADGLRIDHPDGLYDPGAYLSALNRAQAGVDWAERASGSEEAQRWPLCYLVVEKILASHEQLRDSWPVHGTTGYDFCALVNGLGVVPESERVMDELYREVAGAEQDFDELLYRCKKRIIRTQLSSELTVLATSIDSLAQLDPSTRDFTLNGLRDALVEVVACFPVYRTYVSQEGVSEEDRRNVEWAIAHAKRRSLAADVSIFDFVEDVLLQRVPERRGISRREECLRFAMKFQQYTAPVMAKGFEDTACYTYNRLASLNEVGGDPRRFSVSLATFHHANQERLRRWPHAMLATSTHDGKRSEDVRARIGVLTEMAERWGERVERWRRINRGRKRTVDGREVPSANDEYLLYQTLVGAWPLESLDASGVAAFRERIQAYMLKATREAKTHTSWINPNPGYEEAMRDFVSALFGSVESNAFLADFLPFTREVSRYGLFASLSQALLKLTSPGVPDIYQGNETWTFDLVDPDNRRPVDFARRRSMLEELKRLASEGEDVARRARVLAENVEDGRAKLYLTWKTLELRRARRDLFQRGGYTPLRAHGERARHVCGFARSTDQSVAVVAAPRWFAKLSNGRAGLPLGPAVWAGTRLECPSLEHAGYRNVLTGERVPVRRSEEGARFDAADLFGSFSVALLVEETE